MKTFATLFSGGELFGVGAVAAGYEHLFGIEYDDKIASVARLNGFNVYTGDVNDMLPQGTNKMHLFNPDTGASVKLPRPDHLHASPPCPNFSVAKTGGKETELDISMAESVCRAIKHFYPDTFTLENVPAYVHSRSFKNILDTLHGLGYFVDWQNLNSANFAVPQTRNRLWVRASKKLMMPYPAPVEWAGWYQAIEDLIPTLPDAEFAPWQLARLPKEYKDFLIGQGERSKAKHPLEPTDTITANSNQTGIKAFIMSSGNNSFADASEGGGVRYASEPVMTMMANKTEAKIKAFVVDGQANDNGESITVPDGNTPIFTQSATAKKRPARAYVGEGRVVKMTVKALGRFQTVPDWYQDLTTKINGNGIPCLLAKTVLETL